MNYSIKKIIILVLVLVGIVLFISYGNIILPSKKLEVQRLEMEMRSLHASGENPQILEQSPTFLDELEKELKLRQFELCITKIERSSNTITVHFFLGGNYMIVSNSKKIK